MAFAVYYLGNSDVLEGSSRMLSNPVMLRLLGNSATCRLGEVCNDNAAKQRSQSHPSPELSGDQGGYVICDSNP